MLLAQGPILALRSPPAPSNSPFAKSAPFPWVLGEGRRALLEEGSLVWGLPLASQPPVPERERGREGRVGRRPNGAAHNPAAANGAIRKHFSGERTLLEPGVPLAG